MTVQMNNKLEVNATEILKKDGFEGLLFEPDPIVIEYDNEDWELDENDYVRRIDEMEQLEARSGDELWELERERDKGLQRTAWSIASRENDRIYKMVVRDLQLDDTECVDQHAFKLAFRRRMAIDTRTYFKKVRELVFMKLYALVTGVEEGLVTKKYLKMYAMAVYAKSDRMLKSKNFGGHSWSGLQVLKNEAVWAMEAVGIKPNAFGILGTQVWNVKTEYSVIADYYKRAGFSLVKNDGKTFYLSRTFYRLAHQLSGKQMPLICDLKKAHLKNALVFTQELFEPIQHEWNKVANPDKDWRTDVYNAVYGGREDSKPAKATNPPVYN